MVDTVRPLKIENPSEGGTQTDMFPKEADPSQDYLACKGISLEGTQTTLVFGNSGVMTFKDTAQTGGLTLTQLITAVNNTFNNSTNGFTATNVQAAIEEAGKHLTTIEVSDTNNATTSSTTDAVLTTMSITPTAGTYLALFSTSITSNTAGAAISVSLYNNGVQVPTTLMKISPLDGGTLSSGTARGSVAINKVVTVTTGALTIQWSISSGTATCGPRVFNLLRVG